MNIRIYPLLSIHELGNRDNQEDALYPENDKASENERVFVLCDGMGGHEHGEVASQTVCQTISKFMHGHWPSDDRVDDQLVLDAINAAFEALDDKDDGAAKRMGTTLTLVVLHAGGCTAAHIGDSRIYHIRPSEHKVLYRSRDHSLVTDLFQAGEISYEEMKTSPQKNIITKAMQSGEDNRVRPDIVHIGDLQPGDYLYMCSDGMLEQMEDSELVSILCYNASNKEKRECLVRETTSNNDNHSAHLIQIRKVKKERGEVVADDEATNRCNFLNIMPEAIDAIEVEEIPAEVEEASTGKRQKTMNDIGRRVLWLAFIVVTLIAIVMLFFTRNDRNEKTAPVQQQHIEMKPIEHNK